MSNPESTDLATKMLVHGIEPNLISMVDSFVELEFYIEGLRRLLAAVTNAADNLRMCAEGGGGILLRLKEPLTGSHRSLPNQVIRGQTSGATGKVQSAVQDFSLGYEIWQLRLSRVNGTFQEEEIALAGNGTSGEVVFVLDQTLGRATSKANATLATAEDKRQTVLRQIERLQDKVSTIMDVPKPFNTSSPTSLISGAESGKAALKSQVAKFMTL
jgi:hypothetical protein